MSDYLDLGLNSPFLNVSGFLGFNPSKQLEKINFLGGWITPPISYQRRKPASDRTLIQFQGGVLIHTGLPNPGFQKVIKDHAAAWGRMAIPTWVHLISDSPERIRHIVSKVEELDCVAAIELGLQEDLTFEEVKSLCTAAVGKIPLVVDIPISYPNFQVFEKLDLSNMLAISLSAPRGAMVSKNQKLIEGRLFGPGLFPQSLLALRRALDQTLPVILSGGIDSFHKAKEVLGMGAAVVKLDLPFWTGIIPE